MTITRPAAGVKAGPGGVSCFPSSNGADAAPDEAKAHLPNRAPAPAAFRPLTPTQLARMSWYHRKRYEARRRAWVRHQRAKYVPLDGDAHNAMQQTIRLLDDALNGVANGNPPDEARDALRLMVHALAQALEDEQKDRRSIGWAHILTDQQTAELAELRDDGWTWPALAARFHVSRETARRAYRRATTATKGKAA